MTTVDSACCRRLLKDDAANGHVATSCAKARLIRWKSCDMLELAQHLAVVTDQQQGGLVFPARFADQGERLPRVFVVQVASGLVRKNQFGFVCQSAGDGDPLLLATGELPGIVCQSLAEADALQEFFRQIAVGPRSEGHAEQDVFEAGVALQEIEGLENVADGGGPQAVAGGFVEGRHLPAGKDDPAGIRLENSGNQMEKSGLAGAALALQRHLGLFGEGKGLHVDDAMIRAIRGEEGLFEIRDFEQHHRREVRAPGPEFAGEEPPGPVLAKTFWPDVVNEFLNRIRTGRARLPQFHIGEGLRVMTLLFFEQGEVGGDFNEQKLVLSGSGFGASCFCHWRRAASQRFRARA